MYENSTRLEEVKLQRANQTCSHEDEVGNFGVSPDFFLNFASFNTAFIVYAPYDALTRAVMALYYDAVHVLTADTQQGSLKSRVYGGDLDLRSKPAQVYALIVECTKYNTFLKEVIDNTGLLEHESKVRFLSFVSSRPY